VEAEEDYSQGRKISRLSRASRSRSKGATSTSTLTSSSAAVAVARKHRINSSMGGTTGISNSNTGNSNYCGDVDGNNHTMSMVSECP
jgi:hypothetical protein